MRKNSQTNNTFCRFVEVVERLPQCPCDCIPPIPSGPPCPFKPASGEPVANVLQSLLQQPQESNCPLIERTPKGQTADSSQICVFSQPGPINFKTLPQFTCSCIPGTCPELAKNVVRSLGFDPMCACPCPHTVKAPEAEPTETKKKQKRRKKDRTKSTPDASKIDVSAKSSTDETPGAVSASMLRAAGAPENRTGLEPSAVQSAGGAAGVGAVASAAGAVSGVGAVGSAAGGMVRLQPSNQRPKNSAYSGSSNGSLLLEGKGFKIFEIDGEKVLFNYSAKNCPLLKCKCSRKDEDSCGCSEWVRLTKYKNCVCPGARKVKKSLPVLQYVGRS